MLRKDSNLLWGKVLRPLRAFAHWTLKTSSQPPSNHKLLKIPTHGSKASKPREGIVHRYFCILPFCTHDACLPLTSHWLELCLKMPGQALRCPPAHFSRGRCEWKLLGVLHDIRPSSWWILITKGRSNDNVFLQRLRAIFHLLWTCWLNTCCCLPRIKGWDPRSASTYNFLSPTIDCFLYLGKDKIKIVPDFASNVITWYFSAPPGSSEQRSC